MTSRMSVGANLRKAAVSPGVRSVCEKVTGQQCTGPIAQDVAKTPGGAVEVYQGAEVRFGHSVTLEDILENQQEWFDCLDGFKCLSLPNVEGRFLIFSQVTNSVVTCGEIAERSILVRLPSRRLRFVQQIAIPTSGFGLPLSGNGTRAKQLPFESETTTRCLGK